MCVPWAKYKERCIRTINGWQNIVRVSLNLSVPFILWTDPIVLFFFFLYLNWKPVDFELLIHFSIEIQTRNSMSVEEFIQSWPGFENRIKIRSVLNDFFFHSLNINIHAMINVKHAMTNVSYSNRHSNQKFTIDFFDSHRPHRCVRLENQAACFLFLISDPWSLSVKLGLWLAQV